MRGRACRAGAGYLREDAPERLRTADWAGARRAPKTNLKSLSSSYALPLQHPAGMYKPHDCNVVHVRVSGEKRGGRDLQERSLEISSLYTFLFWARDDNDYHNASDL